MKPGALALTSEMLLNWFYGGEQFKQNKKEWNGNVPFNLFVAKFLD
jgi:hypothetical protein